MADVSLNYGSGLEFGPSNDLRIVTDVEFSRQRIVRLLLTGPAQTDETGAIVTPADNLFEQAWGAGLGRDVEGASTPEARADRESRIKTAMTREPTVDQSKPVTVEFAHEPSTGTEYTLVQYTTVDGAPVTVGLS